MRYREPMRSEFDSDEEYESSRSAWEFEEDMKAEEYFLERRGFEF